MNNLEFVDIGGHQFLLKDSIVAILPVVARNLNEAKELAYDYGFNLVHIDTINVTRRKIIKALIFTDSNYIFTSDVYPEDLSRTLGDNFTKIYENSYVNTDFVISCLKVTSHSKREVRSMALDKSLTTLLVVGKTPRPSYAKVQSFILTDSRYIIGTPWGAKELKF